MNIFARVEPNLEYPKMEKNIRVNEVGEHWNSVLELKGNCKIRAKQFYGKGKSSNELFN